MERFNELLEKRPGQTPREDPLLMDKAAEKLR